MKILTGRSNPRLRSVAQAVTTPEQRRQVAVALPLMRRHLSEHGGVGLAGPQVGVPLRFFIWATEGYRSGYVVNPEVTPTGDDTWSFREGCLSLPGQYADIVRPRTVRLTGETLSGQNGIHLTATGLLGRIFLHEQDHLDGILFTDLIPEQKSGV